jgi:hypothetical protein
VSPPRPNPNQEWKKSKAKTEDLLALLNSGFHREKEVDMWRATAGDPYPIETPTKIGSQNGSTSPTITRSCRSPAGSSRSTGPGGTPSRRCRRVSNYPNCWRRSRL